MSLYGLSGRGNDLHAPFHIVGDGGQANLNACFCQPSPPHPAQAVASFPCPEDLLDPTADAMDRLVPGIEPCSDFGFVASPHASRDNAWRAAPGKDHLSKMVTAVGAIGINIAGIDRECIRTPPCRR